MGLIIILATVIAVACAAIAIGGAAIGRRHRALEKLTRFGVVAIMEAARRGHVVLLPEHLALTALAHPELRHVSSAAVLQVQVNELLDRMQARRGVQPRMVRVSTSARAASIRAVQNARARGATGVSPADLLRGVCSGGGGLAALLESRPPGGAPQQASEAGGGYRGQPGEPYARVVVWNDTKTTVEQGLDVLGRFFVLSPVEASHVLLAAHQDGSCSVGTYPAQEAAERVAKAAADLRGRGVPLRLTVRNDRASTAG